MIFYIFQGLTLGFSAAVMPGPYQAYLLSQTMKNGWKHTIPATFAPIASDGPIIALVLFVLTQTPDWFLNIIQIVGGTFILYLAYGAFLAFQSYEQCAATPPDSAQHSFLKAIMVNVLSPGPYIFWSTVSGPIFLTGWKQSPPFGISFVGSFYGSFITFLMILVMIFGLSKRAGPRVVRLLIGTSALVLCMLGLYQLWNGLVGIG